jgi:hypothetical protein
VRGKGGINGTELFISRENGPATTHHRHQQPWGRRGDQSPPNVHNSKIDARESILLRMVKTGGKRRWEEEVGREGRSSEGRSIIHRTTTRARSNFKQLRAEEEHESGR